MSAATAFGGPRSGRRLGWTAEERATRPYARHWRPRMAPLAAPVLDALARSPVAGELLPAFPRNDPEAPEGYGVVDGEVRVHLSTPMPGVTPEMVDWWFGWHSDAPERYQLWHPRAHLHAAWREPPPDDVAGRARYVGRTSIVEEYLGADAGRFAIAFRDPASLGLEVPADGTVVAARIGPAGLPIEGGWLAHRVTPGRMDSWFWLGGRHAAIRGAGPLGPLLARLVGPTAADGRALLVHCAEEMAHLASFLPALHAEQAGRSLPGLAPHAARTLPDRPVRGAP